MKFLLRFFTWWNSETFGTQLWTWRKGVRVGEDDLGNVFYQTRDGKRRWVIYKGVIDASKISPEWHGWLHFTWDEPPTKLALKRKAWEKAHQKNLTGTALAYAPAGSLRQPKAVERRDYEAWSPK